MGAQNKLFHRLVWLIDTVYSAGSIKMADIDRKWARSPYNDGGEDDYGARNLHRHREAIAALFGIEIVCDRTTNEYSIGSRGALDQEGARGWLVNTFAVNNMVNLAGGMKDRIIFEEIPEGARYLSTIVNAMKDERKLFMSYQGFTRPEPHSFLLSPYCLKVFKQRWYLVGKPDDHPEEAEPRVYALDRVKDMATTDHRFSMPKDFKASLFFRGHYGVDRRIENAEKIVIKIDNFEANYIRTLPIHDSQVEMKQEDGFTYFSFYVAPTIDFVQELRKFGADLEVLEPEHLREEFREQGKKLNAMYKEK